MRPVHTLPNPIAEMLGTAGPGQARRWLHELGASDALNLLDRYLATREARRLLESGAPRWVVRNRLVTSFGLSRTHAYRLIAEISQSSQNRIGVGTQ